MSKQQSIGSGFNAASTAEDVIKGIDLKGKTAIVTGGYSGIGVETARVLAKAGAKVIVPARDLPRAHAQVKDFAIVEELDLLDPRSIDRFAESFLKSGNRLDILVNSAGIMALQTLEKDARGFEKQFATNHLGHFQLTLRLKEAFNPGARIVSVSSLGHRYSPVVFDDLNFDNRPYEPWSAYGQSKTANILFAVELERRWKDRGIHAYSVHPGSIPGTGLQKHVPEKVLIDAGVLDENGSPVRDASRGLKTIEQGAATQVWCATSPMLKDIGGVYCENSDISPMMTSGEINRSNMKEARKLFGVLEYAVNPENARRLWAISEEIVRIQG